MIGRPFWSKQRQPARAGSFRHSNAGARWLRAGVAAAWILAASGVTAEQGFLPAEQAYFAGLRERQLNGLLEVHCERLLERAGLPSSLRARTIIELAGLLAQRANRMLEPKDRAALWDRLDGLYASFLKTGDGSGPALLIYYHWAGQLIARAQVLSELQKYMPAQVGTGPDALAAAMKALALLRELDRKLSAELGARGPSKRDDPDQLPREELDNLTMAAEFHLGLAWLALAKAEPDEPKRRSELAEAEKILSRHGREFSTLPVTLEGHLALAEVARLSGRPKEAIALLQRLVETKETPAAYASRARLAWSRILLDQDNPEAALGILPPAAEHGAPSGEAALLRMEALLRRAASLRPTAPATARALQTDAVALLDAVQQHDGPYWSARGDQVLAQFVALEDAGDNFRLLGRLGNVLRLKRDYPRALAVLDAAAQRAETAQQTSVAVQCRYAAGMVAFETGDYAAAADRLEQVAAKSSEESTAAAALLRAAYAVARCYGKTRQPALLARYRALLEEHLRRFGDDPLAGEVHWLLGELAQRQQQWDQAVQHLQAVPTSDARFAVSVQALAGLYHDRFIIAGHGMKKDQAAALRPAIALFTKRLAEPPAALTETPEGSAAMQLCRLVLAELLATPAIDRRDDAEAELRQLLRQPDQLSADVRGRAWEALLGVLLQQGKASEAAAAAANGFAGDRAALLRSLARLDPQEESLPPPQRQAQAAVAEAAAQRLLAEPEALSARDRLNLRLLLAQGYAARGDHANAQRLLQRLQNDAPRDPRLFVSLARSQFENRQFAESLHTWSLLAKGFPRGSDDWLNAVLHMVECHLQRGQRAPAQAMIQMVDSLYPNAGNPTLRAKLAQLRAMLKTGSEPH